MEKDQLPENREENYSDKQAVEYKNKIEVLETEMKKIQEEFNGQRAKMKDLFLQKEDELRKRQEENLNLQNQNSQLQKMLDEAKSQILAVDLKTEEEVLMEKRKAREEIASLQHVLNETVEENSSCRMELDTEVRKLKELIFKLQEENANLRSNLPRENSEGPQLSLSTVTKSLARKVASQLGADNLSLGPDNLEEAMRKAQEDAEELRSLVIPLEEEIKALKEKLRSTDEELQKFKERRTKNRSENFSDSSNPDCDMCKNYEDQLVNVQELVKEKEKSISEITHELSVQKEDLAKEMEFRREMEGKWNEKKEEFKVKMAESEKSSQRAHQALSELMQTYEKTENGARTELRLLVTEREEVRKHLQELQRRNEILVGKYTRKSQDLQNENIDLPNTVEELHLCILNIREELIISKIAQEDAEEIAESLQLKMNMLAEQMEQMEASNEQQMTRVGKDLTQMRSQLELYEHQRKQAEDRELRVQELEILLRDTEKEKQSALEKVDELQKKVSTLIRDLEVGEQVQKDFVMLSQQLQIDMEKIRDSGSQVRWQHEDDIDECQNCHAAFDVGKKIVKQNCRHCGHIFCPSCLTNVVHSGPKQRPSQVCHVCHTLLVPDTAPYFSQELPHLPD